MNRERLIRKAKNNLSEKGDSPNSTELQDACPSVKCFFLSPIGLLRIAREGDCISEVHFDDIPSHGCHTIPTEPILGIAFAALTSYFTKENVDFSELPISLGDRTDFQNTVLNTIRQIPYGEVRTYKWIANQIGRPNAARPIGTAIAGNPLNIIIPCHRVIGSNGRLSGYRGGIWRKYELLELEGYPVEKLKREERQN